MKHCLSNLFVCWSLTFLPAVAQEVCAPCADGLEPFLVSQLCESGVDLAANLTADAKECQAIQLALYQGDCCDTPPQDFCTLCENASQNYNTSKVVPQDPSGPPFEVTCDNYATGDKYLLEGAPGVCNDTERARARAWCECDGVEPSCVLTCEDGNPPPDMTKADQVMGKTCERWAYEYTTLSVEECIAPDISLNFDAKAFCCNEPEPDNCSICPSGMELTATDTVVQTEFFGSATCGEIESYASYLPEGSCSLFFNELLDNPFGAEDECCVDDQNTDSEGSPAGSAGSGASTTRSNDYKVLSDTVTFVVASALWSLAMS